MEPESTNRNKDCDYESLLVSSQVGGIRLKKLRPHDPDPCVEIRDRGILVRKRRDPHTLLYHEGRTTVVTRQPPKVVFVTTPTTHRNLFWRDYPQTVVFVRSPYRPHRLLSRYHHRDHFRDVVQPKPNDVRSHEVSPSPVRCPFSRDRTTDS